MKPHSFDFVRPCALDDALRLLAERQGDCAVLAGGQSLVPMLNLRLATPATIIDIGALAELRGVRVEAGKLVLGALTRHAETESSPLVRSACPLLSDAVRSVGHAAIRNRGTVGGSVALADPSAEMPACLVAIDAVIVVASSQRGERRIAASDFFTGIFSTAKEADELVLSIEVPVTGRRHWFGEIARRHGDFCTVGAIVVGASAARDHSPVRVVLFGVTDRPALLPETAALISDGADLEAIRVAVQNELALLEPGDDPHHRGPTKAYLALELLLRGAAAFMKDDATHA